MADEPKKPNQGGDAPRNTSISPAPADVAGKPPGSGTGAGPVDGKKPNQKVQAEPLSDGTVPTVLNPGESHRTVAKGKTSITSVYRKADITTTLFTFVGMIVAAGLILGGYWFFNRDQSKKTPTPKVTELDKSELEKLGSFFEGNTAGKPSEVLTVRSSALFDQRVAIASDLKVVGSTEVTGPTTLGDLTVNKTTILGVTNVRGALTVSGPLNLQSPATLNAGGAVKGNLAVTGNGSFGGSISAGVINASTVSVSGTLNLNGHLNMGGLTPSASPGSAAGSGATVSITGNDSGGTVTISTGSVPNNLGLGGSLVQINFRSPFPTTPVVVISPNGRAAALLQPYVLKTANFFIIGTSVDAASSNSYSFDYWVVQ